MNNFHDLGDYIEKHKASVVGFYTPIFYLNQIKWRLDGPFPWDIKYPKWRLKKVVILYYNEPSRALTDDELVEIFSIPKECINEKLRDALCPKQNVMSLPWDAVFEDNE